MDQVLKVLLYLPRYHDQVADGLVLFDIMALVDAIELPFVYRTVANTSTSIMMTIVPVYEWDQLFLALPCALSSREIQDIQMTNDGDYRQMFVRFVIFLKTRAFRF